MGWLLVRKHPKLKEMGSKLDLSDLTRDPMLAFQRKWVIFYVNKYLVPNTSYDKILKILNRIKFQALSHYGSLILFPIANSYSRLFVEREGIGCILYSRIVSLLPYAPFDMVHQLNCSYVSFLKLKIRRSPENFLKLITTRINKFNIKSLNKPKNFLN